MKRRFLSVTTLTLIALAFCTASASALTAREIMEKSDNLLQPKTAESGVIMKIYSGGDVIEKEFTLEAMKEGKDDSKALITFTRPTKIKLLTHTHPDSEDDQWLMMTSGKAKRITSSGKSKSFVNSHFCYEDLSSRKIDDYNYKLLPDKKAAGSDCYAVEAVKKKGAMVYDKAVFYVRKSDYFVVKIDFYMDTKYYKTLDNSEIKTVDGIITPYKVVMTMADGKEKTELAVKTLKYNGPVDKSTFNKEALR
jgi:hypothetical protein